MTPASRSREPYIATRIPCILVRVNRARILFIVILITVMVCGSVLYGRMIIDGDGLTYYGLTRSLAEDSDFDLRNQRQQIPQLHLIISPVTRRIASRFSCGFALLYAPFLYISNQIASVHSDFADWVPYRQNEYIPMAHGVAIFAGSVVFGFLTLLITHLMIARSSPSGAALIPLGMFAGTPFLFYVFTMPSYAHAADTFLTAAAFFLACSAAPAFYQGIRFRNVLFGAVLGLSVLLRNNNAVLIPPMLAALLLRKERSTADDQMEPTRPPGKRFQTRDWISLLEVFAGALPFILLFAAFNQSQYGKWIATGYELQAEHWYLWNMLFHPDASLFLWTPVALLGLIGLITGCLKKHPEAICALACVVLVFLSVQFQPNWWGGCSFGTRFFTHLFVFWTWGVLELWRSIGKAAAVLLVICALWTLLLFHISFINAVTPEFRAKLRTSYCRRTPFEMIQSATEEYRLARQNGQTTGPVRFWFQCTARGNFPTLLWLMVSPR